jgi:hypothetical protein
VDTRHAQADVLGIIAERFDDCETVEDGLLRVRHGGHEFLVLVAPHIKEVE